MMTVPFRTRHRADLLSAEARYVQLTTVLGGVWDELHTTADPAHRAELADQAAEATRELASLAPAVFGKPDLVVYNCNGLIWEHYAATERALAEGELELPTGPDCWTAIGHHPDALFLWIELALAEARNRRAELLTQLSDMLSERIDGVAETLDRLAATEMALIDNAAPTYDIGRLAWLRRWWGRVRRLLTR